MAETKKAFERRTKEGFFKKYIKGKGIDIGVGRFDTYDGADIIHPDAMGWDKDNGDATFMTGVEDNTYDYVYNSHLLEHIHNPFLALRNWLRITKPGGYLIIFVPHRDLYEKKRFLPSIWNRDHKFFLLPDEEDLPHTLNFTALIEGAIGNDVKVEYIKTCDEGWESVPENQHSYGEYSIEAVLKKL